MNIPRQRRYPRSPIEAPLAPRRASEAPSWVDAILAVAQTTPTNCTLVRSGGAPDAKYASPGFQFCLLKYEHAGPHLVEDWEGARYYVDPVTLEASWTKETT